MFSVSLILAFVIAGSVMLLPWRPWSTREVLEADGGASVDLSDITVLIPARNEADAIGETLAGIAAQGTGMRVILIDDESTDATASIARASGIRDLTILSGSPLPTGWSGKLWALEQGLSQVQTPLVLLLDADIVLRPGTLAALRSRLYSGGLQLVSLMAHLGMRSRVEQLLLPAFVYFFKLIYPFALANDPRSRMAAAAGGCILLQTGALTGIGGFASLRQALIDDCTLAARIKRNGGRTWLGLTHSAVSLRRYTLADCWNMVARTAYTQLFYSPALLLVCTVLMGLYYVMPAVGVFVAPGGMRGLALATLALSMLPYLPILRFYRLPRWLVLTLPLVGALYLAMTWTSAIRYHRGERSRWKGRQYQRSD